MKILTWIFMGLVVGLLAKFILPDKKAEGVMATILIGVAGAFLGGFIGSRLGLGKVTGFNIESVILATVGAVILLFLYRIIKR